MIGPERQREHSPFLRKQPVRNLTRYHYLYPTLRQGLHAWLRQRPPGRVLLPDHVPQGVHDPFLRLGWSIYYYHVPSCMRLKRTEVAVRFQATRPDIAVLVHPFGVYVEENVALMRGLCRDGTMLFEDFAHTVWDSTVALSGDLCGFSFAKSLGVSSGSLLWLTNRENIGIDTPGLPGRGERRLGTLLARQLAVEHWCATVVRSRVSQVLLLRATARLRAYYPFLLAHYPTLRAPPTARSIALLDRIDTEGVAAQRRRIAQRYARELDPRLLPDLPRECFERQALFGFPVLVDDREAFHSALYRQGVRGTVLCDRWWFDTDRSPGGLYRRHYLLPLSHYMSDTQVERVIGAAAQALR